MNKQELFAKILAVSDDYYQKAMALKLSDTSEYAELVKKSNSLTTAATILIDNLPNDFKAEE